MHFYELDAWTKNDLVYTNFVQNIGHTLYNNFIEGKPAETDWIRLLERDKNIGLIQRHPVEVIPQPELIDPLENCFENDDPTKFKEDEDEIRLQNMMKSMNKEEFIEEEEQSISTIIPLVSSDSKSKLIRKNQSVLVNPLRKPPSSPSISSLGSKKKINPNSPRETMELGIDDIDLDKEEIDYSLSDDEECFDVGLDSSVVLNDTIPPIVESAEFLSHWPKSSHPIPEISFLEIEVNSSVGRNIAPGKVQIATIDPKSRVTKKLPPTPVDQPTKKKEKKDAYLLVFEYSESKTPLGNQVLAFAKRLRDDQKLNKVLSAEDKNVLKGFVKESYDWLNKNKEVPKENVEVKCRELEEKVNAVISAAVDKK
jgi:hypothetical protein